jgi:hypothetical protein
MQPRWYFLFLGRVDSENYTSPKIWWPAQKWGMAGLGEVGGGGRFPRLGGLPARQQPLVVLSRGPGHAAAGRVATSWPATCGRRQGPGPGASL